MYANLKIVSIWNITNNSKNAFIGESKEINIFFMVSFMLAMLGMGSAYGGLFLYTPELYPTEVR